MNWFHVLEIRGNGNKNACSQINPVATTTQQYTHIQRCTSHTLVHAHEHTYHIHIAIRILSKDYYYISHFQSAACKWKNNSFRAISLSNWYIIVLKFYIDIQLPVPKSTDVLNFEWKQLIKSALSREKITIFVLSTTHIHIWFRLYEIRTMLLVCHQINHNPTNNLLNVYVYVL